MGSIVQKYRSHSSLKLRYYAAILILTMASLGNALLSIPSAAIKRVPLAKFPATVGDWKRVSEQRLSSDIMDILKVDDYFMGTYKNEKGDLIDVYIGYFETQRDGKQVHSPRQCLPGAGWLRVKHMELPLPISGNGTRPFRNTSVNVDLMVKGDDKELYVWWYQARGRIYSSEYMNKLYLMWDSLTRKRTDGALVRINIPVNRSFDESLSTISKFVMDIYDYLPQFIPN